MAVSVLQLVVRQTHNLRQAFEREWLWLLFWWLVRKRRVGSFCQ